METKVVEKRTTQKLRVSTLKMVREHGFCGESFDTVVRRLAFKKSTGCSGDDPLYVQKGLV